MDTNDKPYQPIDCSFYDRLESESVKKSVVSFELESGGARMILKGLILDLFSRDKVEYAVVGRADSTGDPITIRLDTIVSVNGHTRPGFSQEKTAC